MKDKRVDERAPRRRRLARRGKLAKFDKYKKEGFVTRIVNNVDDKIEDLEEMGYAKVTDENGEFVRRSVGAGIEAFLMHIPQEEYDLNQQDKELDNIAYDQAVGKEKGLLGGTITQDKL